MTEVSFLKGSVKNWKGDALLVMMHEEDCKQQCPVVPPYDAVVKALIKHGDFSGKENSFVKMPLFEGSVHTLYLAGMGSVKTACTPYAMRNRLTDLLRKIGRDGVKSLLLMADTVKFDNDSVLGEAVALCGYVFDKYKSKNSTKKTDDEFVLEEVCVAGFDTKTVKLGSIYASSQLYSRSLANEPGNAISPALLAEQAEELAKERRLDCEVWDEKRLAKEGMGALLAVGSGSERPPRLIHLVYHPQKHARKKVIFVGKGITFDSGGLDLKPSEFMKTMKGDKTGACNVLGIMRGVAELAPAVEVHGVIAAAENMPSGKAFRPDDIIKARNGKTIEIDNTDAEGRLVLADALCFASEQKPDVIVDIATLTGACAVALGNWTAGIFSNNDDLAADLIAAGKRRGERLWRMPMDDEKIGESLKSRFADLINCGRRYGGATFAAMFLNEFVEKGIAWAHLDIAGVDFYEREWSVYSAGASAWGVRTCLDFVKSL